MKLFLLFLVVLITSMSVLCRAYVGAPSDFFSTADAKALRQRLLEQLSRPSDGTLTNEYFAVSALAALDPSGEVSKEDLHGHASGLCGLAKSTIATQFEKPEWRPTHNAVGIMTLLKCENFAPAALAQTTRTLIEKVLESEDDVVLEQIYAVALTAQRTIKLGGASPVYIKVAAAAAERILDLMEPDGHFRGSSDEEEASATSSGLAFLSLALLKELAGPPDPKADAEKAALYEHVASAAETAAKLLAAADEEDDHIIEFEDIYSPVRATSLFWLGLEALARVGEDIPVTEAQVSKFAEYFLLHKRVSDPVDAYFLMRALRTVATNAFKKSPLVVTIANPSILASSKGDESLLKIRVTNVFGKFASKATVLLTLVYPSDNPKKIIVHNQQATPVEGNKTLYAINLLATKPDQGLYTVELSVAPENKLSLFYGATGIARGFKVVSNAELADVAIQVVDSIDEEDAELASKVAYPGQLADVLKANQLQHVLVTFRVRSQGRPYPVQQAFVVFRHEESGHEVILPGLLQGNKYKVHLNLRESGRAFQGRSGKYSIRLLVGDAFLHRPYFWHMADIVLSLGKQKEETQVSTEDALKGLKPEIHHKFRTPEKRPPEVVSLAFAAAVVAVPLLVLLVGLFSLGTNIRNFPVSGTGFLSAIGFQGCIISVIALYVLYWIKLTMLETLVYLLGLGVVTVLFGWQALRHRLYARLAAQGKRD